MSDIHPERRRRPNADEVEGLFYLIGKAVWYVQHLEDILSNSIAVKVDLKDAEPGTVSDDTVREILKKRRRKTLGDAIGVARKNVLYDEHLQQRLDEFLDERNWLVHRLMHQNSDDMNVDGKRELLFNRIEQVFYNAIALAKIIADDIESFVVSKGVDREQSHARARRDFAKGRGLL